MAIETINLGNYANDGTGDDLRTAFTKVNANFALLDSEAAINNGENLGAGAGLFKQASGASLQFKGLTSADTSVVITSTADSVNLQAKTKLSTDATPTLGADLSLNGYAIKAINGGDVQSNIYNLSVPTLHALVSLLLESNSLNVEMGTFGDPASATLDMNGNLTDGGGFIATPPANQLNFGEF